MHLKLLKIIMNLLFLMFALQLKVINNFLSYNFFTNLHKVTYFG